MIIKNSYVDDLFILVDIVCEVEKIICNIEMLLSYGGFCVKYWIIFGDVDEYFVGMNVLNVE